MTKLHVFGICFIITALLACGLTNACHDQFTSLKEVGLVAIGAIAGDARNTSREPKHEQRVAA